MGNMDQPEIKTRLGLPPKHYLATITPLGFPLTGATATPDRKDLGAFIR